MHPRSVFHGVRSQLGLSLLLGIVGVPLSAAAQDERSGTGLLPPASASATAQNSAAAAAFSTWAMSARSDTQRAVGRITGGFDGASEDGMFESSVDARVLSRVSLRAGASTTPASAGLGLRLEGKLDALRQEGSGVDLALAGGYEQNGFNEVAAALATVALGGRLGGLYLLGMPGRSNEKQEPQGQLSAVQTSYDFGEISMKDGKVRHDFTVQNNSDKPVTITKLYTSCMCTTAALTAGSQQAGPFGMEGHGGAIPTINVTVAPGDEARVTAVFDPAAHGSAGVGTIERSIFVNSKSNPRFELTFKATVKP